MSKILFNYAIEKIITYNICGYGTNCVLTNIETLSKLSFWSAYAKLLWRFFLIKDEDYKIVIILSLLKKTKNIKKYL